MIGYFEAFDLNICNTQEKFNEFIVATLTTIICLFTDWVDESHKYLLGYFFIIVISIFLLANSIILILSLSKSTYQILRLIFTRLNNWLAKKFPNRFKVIKKAKTKEEIDEDKQKM